MTLIYRVENVNGEGPYSAEWEHTEELHREHSDDPDHPGPSRDLLQPGERQSRHAWQDDSGLNIDRNEYCGFASEAELHAWFDGWEERLTEARFHMATFDVEDEDVRHGTMQVVFRAEKYKPINRKALANTRGEIYKATYTLTITD